MSSESTVRVVRLGAIIKHPNADTLSVTLVEGGYPAIIRTGEFAEGDLAVFVPIDSVVPEDERWAFLGSDRRIRASRKRGVFSMGLLTAADPSWPQGFDAGEALHITKWEPPEGSEFDDHGPTVPVVDIEGLRAHQDVFIPGEEVWITEKLNGQTARFLHDGRRLHAGSAIRWKKLDSPVTWARIAERYDIERKLSQRCPDVVIYGEAYGSVGGMRYDAGPKGDNLALFDALDFRAQRWFGVDEFLGLAATLGLPVVPELYRGPWDPAIAKALAEGPTTLGGGHVREGIVVKPIKERIDLRLKRVELKLHGEGYHLRKRKPK